MSCTLLHGTETTMPSGIGHDPKVSILMPVYNGERYLDEAIASVIGQDFTDFEFIIIDDASTDSTPRILQQWAARDSRIVTLRAPENGGITRALNRGLAIARGRYVGRQDADDVCLGGRLRRQVDVLDREPDVVLVSANIDLIDSAGERLGTAVVYHPPTVTAYLLHFDNAVGGHGQVMFRPDVVREVGGYREEIEVAQDYDLWARLCQRGRIVMLPMIGMKHRRHEQQSSTVSRQRQRRHALATSRRMLQALLQRDITAEEEDAVASVWKAEGRSGVAARAQRIFREAYGHFVKAGASRSHRRRVRIATALRWFRSALVLARGGKAAEAARQFILGLWWHPGALAPGVRHVMSRAWGRLRAAARRGLRAP
jgi:GT2 family glycosyltransferase